MGRFAGARVGRFAVSVETKNTDTIDFDGHGWLEKKKVNIQCAFLLPCTKNTLKKQDSSRQTPAPMSQSQHAWGRVKDPSHLRKRRCPTGVAMREHRVTVVTLCSAPPPRWFARTPKRVVAPKGEEGCVGVRLHGSPPPNCDVIA